jgi:hypothetical protein
VIETTRFVRKPFYVDGIQVTASNMEQVAAWCAGDIQESPSKGGGKPASYIKVKVKAPLNDRQTKAYVGDWVLLANGDFKVYTHKSFVAAFDSLPTHVPGSIIPRIPAGGDRFA